jgi:riboflavin biosynthesis pyrimidine reductase
MPDLIYHVNASLDGFIARENGSPEGLVWDESVVPISWPRSRRSAPS